MNEPLTPSEKWLLPIYIGIAERFGPEMGTILSLLRRDVDDGLSSGYTKSLVRTSSQYGFQIIMDGISRNSPNRKEPSRVNSNQLYRDAAAEGPMGLPNLTLNLLEIGWENFVRLRDLSLPNPFELIYTSGESMRTDVNHDECDEGTILSFLIWFVGIMCEDERFLIRYMITINYRAKERLSVIDFELAAQDPGIVGLIAAHGQPVPPNLLN